MNEKLEQLKAFILINYNIILTPQQVIFAEYFLNNRTACLSTAYREGQMVIIDAIREMEQIDC